MPSILRLAAGRSEPFSAIRAVNQLGSAAASGIPYYQNCIHFQSGPASNGGTSYASAAYQRNKNGPNSFNGESWFKPAFRTPGTNGGGDAGVPLADAAFYDENGEGPGRARPFTPGCNPNPLTPCSLVPFQLGNIPRETEAITGPILKSEDVSLLKDFAITERVKFQLKGEAFDVFNRHRFGLPDQAPGDSTGTFGFGIPGSVDLRTAQHAGFRKDQLLAAGLTEVGGRSRSASPLFSSETSKVAANETEP